MKNGLIIFILAFTLGLSLSVGFNSVLGQEKDQNIANETIKEEFKLNTIDGKQKDYTIEELQLLELRKISERLANIQNLLLWEK